jgi:hypothetical protein
MLLEGKVRLIEKLVNNSKTRSVYHNSGVKVLGSKDRETRKYSTILDTAGRPIVKLYFGPRTYTRRKGYEKRTAKIATRRIVASIGICFLNNDGFSMLSNFKLTDFGYQYVRTAFLKPYDDGSIEEQIYNIIIRGEYYANLGSRAKRLRISGNKVCRTTGARAGH